LGQKLTETARHCNTTRAQHIC